MAEMGFSLSPPPYLTVFPSFENVQLMIRKNLAPFFFFLNICYILDIAVADLPGL
jgi:hypothetical protein